MQHQDFYGFLLMNTSINLKAQQRQKNITAISSGKISDDSINMASLHCRFLLKEGCQGHGEAAIYPYF